MRVAYRSEDEIGKVVNSYNMMLDREVERVSEIREAHHSILDSVTYASRIQRGLLPKAEPNVWYGITSPEPAVRSRNAWRWAS